ncbi:MAG: ATP-binding protein [Ruminococcaceae bacterium]|nr:ATP-binding protein [Oscillospiraceae bacterium]
MKTNIVTGHYGSGKTEFALNLAMNLKKENKKVSICDLDIVNPYFRTNDARKLLEENGIKVISSQFANTNVDIPVLPGEVLSVFADKETYKIFDVGGDDDGAIALGTYFHYISKEPYNMYFVVNTLRPMTSTKEEIYEMARNIEAASRLKITDIVNNTNLQGLTKAEDIVKSIKIVDEAAKMLGVNVKYISGKKEILDNLPQGLQNKRFNLDIYLKMPF